jgi:hypothetical protein
MPRNRALHNSSWILITNDGNAEEIFEPLGQDSTKIEIKQE